MQFINVYNFVCPGFTPRAIAALDNAGATAETYYGIMWDAKAGSPAIEIYDFERGYSALGVPLAWKVNHITGGVYICTVEDYMDLDALPMTLHTSKDIPLFCFAEISTLHDTGFSAKAVSALDEAGAMARTYREIIAAAPGSIEALGVPLIRKTTSKGTYIYTAAEAEEIESILG